MVEFMPMSLTGRSSATNFISISTAKLMILTRLETCFGKAIDQFGVGVKETCKVAVSPFVTADEFVANTEAGHKPALLEPKYGAKSPKKDDLDSVNCNHLFRNTGAGGVSNLLSEATQGKASSVPLSLLMSLLPTRKPGISLRFLSQNMVQRARKR